MASTVLITGVAGFTGRHLVRFLRKLPERVKIIGLDHIEQTLMLDVDAFHIVDISDTRILADIMERYRPSHLIHLAAVLPPANERDMWFVNVGGTSNLINALEYAGCKETRVLSLGSAGEYLSSREGLLDENSPSGGETINGRTKWAQTTIALAQGKERGIPVMVVRPFNLIGPGLPRKFVAAELCEQFLRPDHNEIKVGNTNSERDFIDVRDAVAAYWVVVTKGIPGEIYNVCTSKPTSINELIRLLSELTGTSYKISVDSSKMRNVDFDRVYGKYDKLHTATGWQPRITLAQSLRDMLEESGS